MKNKIVSIILSLSVAMTALTGCAGMDLSAMPQLNLADFGQMVADDFAADYYAPKPVKFTLSDAAKGAELLLSNTDYLSSLTQTDLEYKLQKKGVTLDEYTDFIAKQTLDFTTEEEAALNESMERIQERLFALGFSFPIKDSVNIIKTTMQEEPGAGGYTHGDDIYLGENVLQYALSGDSKDTEWFDTLMSHELFHVLTRNDPAFKENMYRLIGFTVDETEPDFPEAIREKIASNPDVEGYNNHATFTINGVPTEATIVSYFSKPFSEGSVMLDSIQTGIVPIENPDKIYTIKEVPDFFDVIGYNTGYVIAAEECLADNFKYALTYGKDADYDSPAIVQGILDYLETGAPTSQVTGEFTPVTEKKAHADRSSAIGIKGALDVEEIAKEVVRGLWGNGTDRIDAIEAEGVDSKAVQERVNEIMSGR